MLKETGKRGGQVSISVSDPKSFNPITAKYDYDLKAAAEEKIDELLNRAAFEFDFAKRKALASELQKIMAEELPIIPLGSRKAFLATSEALGNVETFTANAYGVQEFIAIIFRRRSEP